MKKTERYLPQRLSERDVNIFTGTMTLFRETNAWVVKENVPCFTEGDMML